MQQPVVSVAFSSLIKGGSRSTCATVPLKVDALVPFDGFKLNVTCQEGAPLFNPSFYPKATACK